MRENSARSAPLLKRCLKRREKSLFLSLFLSSSLALTQTTFAPKKRFDLSFFLFPFSSGIVVSRARRFLSFSLFFSSRLSSETRRDRAFRDIYTRARARPTRSATNEYSEREERKTKKRRKKRALFDEDFDLERKGQKKKGSKKPASSLFLVFCLAHFFFFASAFAFFSSFSFMKSFSLATMKNVLLWKGLRRRGRTTKGHREEEEEGNDNDNNNNNKGCVGTRVIATREIRFLFFRRTVRRRSRYTPSFFLSFSLL